MLHVNHYPNVLWLATFALAIAKTPATKAGTSLSPNLSSRNSATSSFFNTSPPETEAEERRRVLGWNMSIIVILGVCLGGEDEGVGGRMR